MAYGSRDLLHPKFWLSQKSTIPKNLPAKNINFTPILLPWAVAYFAYVVGPALNVVRAYACPVKSVMQRQIDLAPNFQWVFYV